jgi:hypothetical protein
MENKEKMPDFKQLYQDILNHVLNGKGFSSVADRQAAFNNAGLADPVKTLVEKVAHHAYKITDSDIDTVKASGIGEDQIFELVICTALGQASRQYMSGLSALAEATTEKKGGSHAS